jgi:RNA polymerase sigma factor (sigma-70 family)
LARLCARYWYPLYAYLRRQGKSPHDAQDLTQGFLLHLLKNQGLERVQREKGRFRSFLLAALKNFLADEWEKSQAQKRGGGVAAVSLDTDDAEERYQSDLAGPMEPDKLFERRWALTLLERVLGQLEAEFAAAGKKERFESLQVFLSGEPAGISYAEAGRQIGMSEGAVKVAVLRMRQRYRELLRGEIAQTVATEGEVEEELRYLLEVLGR